MNKAKHLLLALPIAIAATLVCGCSGGVASTAPVQVSQGDVNQSQVFRAKQFLDTIEKLPAGQRQMVANIPKTAEALYSASQIDPATKKRIGDLGLTVSAPAQPGRRR